MNEKLLNQAFRLLSIRAHSKKELTDKLMRKSADQTEVCEVINRLEELGYINDKAFVQNYVSYRAANSPRGHFSLKAELYKKGILKEEIENVLNNEEYSEETMAKDFLERKKKVLSALQGEKRKQKIFQILTGRGFSLETIYRTLESW